MLMLCGYLAGYNVGKVSASLTSIRADLDLSLFQAGTVASSYSVAAMLSAIAVGMLVSQIGAVLSVYTGLICIAVAGAVGAMANGYVPLLGGRVLEGFGYILLAISIPILINKVIAARSRSMAMGIWGTFIPGGVALSMLLALIAESQWPGQWRLLWWFTCVLAMACVVLVTVRAVPVLKTIGLNESVSDATGPRKPPLYTSVFQRDPLLLAAGFLLYSMFFVSLITYLPTVLAETSDIEFSTATRVSVFVALFNILGNLAGGWLIGRGVQLKTVLVIALVGSCLFSSLVFLDHIPLPIRVASGLIASCLGGMLPASVFASVASFVSARQSGLLLGVVFQSLGTGQVAGPVVLAALVESMGHWNWGAVYYLCLGLVSMMVLWPFQSRFNGKRISG